MKGKEKGNLVSQSHGQREHPAQKEISRTFRIRMRTRWNYEGTRRILSLFGVAWSFTYDLAFLQEIFYLQELYYDRPRRPIHAARSWNSHHALGLLFTRIASPSFLFSLSSSRAWLALKEEGGRNVRRKTNLGSDHVISFEIKIFLYHWS